VVYLNYIDICTLYQLCFLYRQTEYLASMEAEFQLKNVAGIPEIQFLWITS